jgi:integrase
MAIQKRTLKRTSADGTTTSRVVWRARVPDPTKPPGASAKIERTFARKTDAERWERERLTAIESGSYISDRQGATPLRDVAEQWRATWNVKPLAPKTQRDYASILENHVLPRFGDVRVSAISAAAVQDWVNDLHSGKGLHAETVHHAYVVLRGVLKTAVRRGLIASNPCATSSVDLPSKRKARTSASASEQLYLSADELRQLVDAMPEHWRTPTLIAAWCGLRAGELWALRRQDVDPLHGTITVRYALKDVWGNLIAGPTKTHASRSMSVPKFLRPALTQSLTTPTVRARRARAGQPTGYPAISQAGELVWTDDASDPTRLLFTTPNGRPVRHANFYVREFRPTVERLWPAPHRLNGLVWHSLRHTCASLSLAVAWTYTSKSSDLSLHAVKERLGHEDIQTTVNRYGHMLASVDEALADGLGAMHDAANVVEPLRAR